MQPQLDVCRNSLANEATVYYSILYAYDPLVNNIFRREIMLRHQVQQCQDLLQYGRWDQQPDAYQAILDAYTWALERLYSLLEEKKTLATDPNYVAAVLAAMPRHKRILYFLSVAQTLAYHLVQRQAALENEIEKNAMNLLVTFQV